MQKRPLEDRKSKAKDDAWNEKYRQLKIDKELSKHLASWEKTFGKGGKNGSGETLHDYISSMYPARWKYNVSGVVGETNKH